MNPFILQKQPKQIIFVLQLTTNTNNRKCIECLLCASFCAPTLHVYPVNAHTKCP